MGNLRYSGHLCALLLLVSLISLSCAGKQPKRPSAPSGESKFETISPLQAIKFEAEKQNRIFQQIVEGAKASSCQEPRRKAQIRLVTASEYILGIEHAFEIDLDDKLIKIALPTDTVGTLGYEQLRQFNIVSAERLAAYLTVNEQISKLVKDKKSNLLNCGRSPRECVQDWITARLPRLWRKHLTPEDVQNELNFFDANGGNIEAFSRLVERLLLSPYFLFRQALGTEGKLNSWEIAGMMSDSLWALPPSNELVQLAEQDALNSTDAIRKQVSLMINDPKFYSGVKQFTSAWLNTATLERKNFSQANTSVITDEIKAGLKEESAAFLYYLVKSQQDQFSKIFTAPFTLGSPAFANVYGLTPTNETVAGLPANMTKLNFPVQRQGLVSQPGIIVSSSNLETTNVPLRGKSMMEKFLCQTLETPPNIAAVVANTKFDMTVSVRDAFEKATNVGSCGECHKLVNGIGYGLESIGPDGRIQTIDGHKFPVSDPAGSLFFPGTAKNAPASTFTGPKGLAETLGSSKEAEVCLAVQVFRMVYGRLEEEADVCLIANAYKKADQTELEFDGLLTEMIIKRSGMAE